MQKLTIAIVGKYQAEGVDQSLHEIARFAQALGHRVVFEHDTARALGESTYPAWTLAQIGTGADFAVVVGGDGTMLGIARQLAPYNVPLVGINQGRLGFMTDIPIEDKERVLGEILAGHYEVEERSLLSASVSREGKTILEALALNDVVVARGSVSGMVELTVDVDGRFMYSQRSDGLILATPTGSTAYALSADGPILHPRLAGIVRPIALPDSSRIDITVTGGREVSANFDMQSYTTLQRGDCVSVERAPMSIRFLHPIGYSYFVTLRQKLHWNQHPLGSEAKSPSVS
jgi:NAD+ kinase